MFSTGQTHVDLDERTLLLRRTHVALATNTRCPCHKPALTLTNAPTFPCHVVNTRPDRGGQRCKLSSRIADRCLQHDKLTLTLMNARCSCHKPALILTNAPTFPCHKPTLILTNAPTFPCHVVNTRPNRGRAAPQTFLPYSGQVFTT